ncbi:MAG: hypothetical protein WD696_07115 [Bryobacteraceae bacterium]
MTLKEQIELRRRQWEEFNLWEAQQPPVEREPAAIIADVGALWKLLPPDVRAQDPDPEKRGVQRLFAACAILNGKR